MVQLSATRGSCIAILLVSLVSFAAITLCVASQRVFIVVLVVVVVIHFRYRLSPETFGYTLLYPKYCREMGRVNYFNELLNTYAADGCK
jgi:hypothetical protein